MAKNENFQKSLNSALDIHGMNLYAGFWVNLTTQWLNFCVGAQNFVIFYPNFPYILPKMPENDPTLTRHISATVASWEASEPILENR